MLNLTTLPAVLTEDEVSLITGEASLKKQIESLKEMQYCFDINAKGKPLVSRIYFESRMSPQLFQPTRKQTQPNWGNLKQINAIN